MRAPIDCSISMTLTISGSAAALTSVVVPSASTAAKIRFIVPVTLG